jgi:hypothetical protein
MEQQQQQQQSTVPLTPATTTTQQVSLDATKQTPITQDAKPLGEKWSVTPTPIAQDVKPLDFTNPTEVARALVESQRTLKEREDEILKLKQAHESNPDLMEYRKLKERLKAEDRQKLDAALSSLTDVMTSRYTTAQGKDLTNYFDKSKVLETGLANRDIASAIEIFAKCAQDMDSEVSQTEELKLKVHTLEDQLKRKSDELELRKLNMHYNESLTGSAMPIEKRFVNPTVQTPLTSNNVLPATSTVSAASMDSLPDRNITLKRKKPTNEVLSAASVDTSPPVQTQTTMPSAPAPAYYIAPNKYGDTSVFNQIASEVLNKKIFH